jgi:hypothetical protein
MAEIALGRRNPDPFPDLKAAKPQPHRELFMNYVFKTFSYHVFLGFCARGVVHNLNKAIQPIVLTHFSYLTHRFAKKSTRLGYRSALS